MSIFIVFSTQSKCKLKKLRRWESNRGPQYRLKANFTNKFWETSHLQFKGTKSFIKNFLLKGERQRNSVARFGDLLDIGQLFKAHGNNYFAQSANTFQAIFVNLSKSFILLSKSFLGNFYRHLAIFYWSHCCKGRRSQKRCRSKLNQSDRFSCESSTIEIEPNNTKAASRSRSVPLQCDQIGQFLKTLCGKFCYKRCQNSW